MTDEPNIIRPNFPRFHEVPKPKLRDYFSQDALMIRARHAIQFAVQESLETVGPESTLEILAQSASHVRSQRATEPSST